MKLTRSWLLKNARPSFPLSTKFDIPDSLKSIANNLLSIGEVEVEGQGYYLNSADRLRLTLNVKVILVMTCAVSLEPVDYPLEVAIDQWFTFGEEVERDDLLVVTNDELDLIQFIWENIYLSIPTKVVKACAKLPKTKGENWKFLSEDDTSKKTKIDPRLEKLKDFSRDK